MNNLQKLASLRSETAALCERIMASGPDSEFSTAFAARDINHVESLLDSLSGGDADLRAMHEGEMRWETGCGCNGDDSPFHTYFSGYGCALDYERSGRKSLERETPNKLAVSQFSFYPL